MSFIEHMCSFCPVLRILGGQIVLKLMRSGRKDGTFSCFQLLDASPRRSYAYALTKSPNATSTAFDVELDHDSACMQQANIFRYADDAVNIKTHVAYTDRVGIITQADEWLTYGCLPSICIETSSAALQTLWSFTRSPQSRSSMGLTRPQILALAVDRCPGPHRL